MPKWTGYLDEDYDAHDDDVVRVERIPSKNKISDDMYPSQDIKRQKKEKPIRN